MRLDIEKTRETLIARKPGRSQWDRARREYALALLCNYEDAVEYDPDTQFRDRTEFTNILLNGAQTWHQYCEGGNALVYTGEIIERLFPPSLRKAVERKADKGEIDIMAHQALCLAQAATLLYRSRVTVKE